VCLNSIQYTQYRKYCKCQAEFHWGETLPQQRNWKNINYIDSTCKILMAIWPIYLFFKCNSSMQIQYNLYDVMFYKTLLLSSFKSDAVCSVSVMPLQHKSYSVWGTRLYGTTTLAWPVLLWPFFALPILLLVHFGADLFDANFTKIIFSFAFCFNFF